MMTAETMAFDDEPVSSSAIGILRCLRRLAEEAAGLKLWHTMRAIEEAADTMACEGLLSGPEQVRMSLH